MRSYVLAVCVLVGGACGQTTDPLADAASSDAGAASSSTSTQGTAEVEVAIADDGGTDDDTTIVATAISDEVVARVTPNESAEPVATLSNPTERGGPLVFQAIGSPSDGWVEVLLPIRPNGSTGWIKTADVQLSQNPYRIELDVGDYQLTVFIEGEELITTTVAIGTGDTPTPRGDFYLIELLQPPDASGPYGPFAYGLSGYSETLDSFAGGPGIIGIHGTNRPDLLGTDVSHGCIRVDNDVISEMATFLPLGTPITIEE